jgi:hypothetical protein
MEGPVRTREEILYVMCNRLFRLQLRDTFSKNTPYPPPGDTSGGVVYHRIFFSAKEASQLMGNS